MVTDFSPKFTKKKKKGEIQITDHRPNAEEKDHSRQETISFAVPKPNPKQCMPLCIQIRMYVQRNM